VKTYWRLHPADEDPRRLLDPDEQYSEPWEGADHGPCDKCEGSGETEHECQSCRHDGPTDDCPACHGKVRFMAECPACLGSGHITDSRREGVSVFPDPGGLARYMDRRDADIGGSTLVELEGEQSDDRDFDADEGALLVKPTRIVSTREIDDDLAKQLRSEAGVRAR
jgi:predicted nucleic acid-binding Zn ribbon protein